MNGLTEIMKSYRKDILNISFFVFSVLIVTGILPDGRGGSTGGLLGIFLIVASCYLMLYLFLTHFRPEILEVNRKTLFIILIILLFIILTRIVISFAGEEMLFLIPFTIIPIVVCTFYDARLALFTFMITLMLAGFIVPRPFDFVFINFISGIAAIFALSNIYRRARLLISAMAVVVSYSVIHLSIALMNITPLSELDWFDFKLFLGNGVLILASYPLIILFEKKFYFLSDTTLLELSNVNNRLLREFAEEAPGSFQHSLQVANLAEEAARVIGANPLLARAGSLYHDIGKIVNSRYFIENQGPESDPHQDLDPIESSGIIINHVNEGILLARKHKLPVQIIDFIRTHHGTSRANYFYVKYTRKNKPDPEIKKLFSYPGPKPFSREMAIVMMADAVEAASRTLAKYTETSVSDLIEKIFTIQEQDEQFSEAPLTFRQMSDIKNIFRKRLLNIHHIRAVYPDSD